MLALKGDLERLEPMLESIRVPVAVVHGTKDRLVPYANVGYMLERLRGARVRRVRLDGANHFIPWTHEAEVRGAIEWVIGEASGEDGDATQVDASGAQWADANVDGGAVAPERTPTSIGG